MKKLIVIPARFASTRLPGKPLIPIQGKPLIQWVYEGALKSELANGIVVATDDERIRDAVVAFGGKAVMTSASCQSGTDRVHEAAAGTGAELVVNLQGDEPMIDGNIVDRLFSALEKENLAMATLCTPLSRSDEYTDPNVVKVVIDRSGFALYFSRSPIPFIRDKHREVPVYKHIGIYGFSIAFLTTFVTMERGVLEAAESLEQLRVMENGHRIRVIPVTYNGTGIDTQEDLARFISMLNTQT